MSQVYRTKDGDVLDYLVWIQYPSRPIMGTVEQVLAANPGVAELGPYLPEGVLIIFPTITEIPPRRLAPPGKYWAGLVKPTFTG